MRATLRQPVTHWLAAGYLVCLIAVVGWMWPDQALFSVAAQSTRSIVVVLVLSLVTLVAAYAPAVSATAIVGEREDRTYDLLLASRLRPWEVIGGKVMARFITLMIPVLWSFPFLAVCFFLGAVSTAEASCWTWVFSLNCLVPEIAGTTMLASIAMIAMTTISSTKVNPFCPLVKHNFISV